MTETPELRRARFQLVRAEDALRVVIAALETASVPGAARPGLIGHVDAIQLQVDRLRGLLGPPRPSQAA
jgi:hypothetical protein